MKSTKAPPGDFSPDERNTGLTFALDNVGFIDFESRSRTDIKAGTYRYAADADAIVLCYAIGTGPVVTISVGSFGSPLSGTRCRSFSGSSTRVCSRVRRTGRPERGL